MKGSEVLSPDVHFERYAELLDDLTEEGAETDEHVLQLGREGVVFQAVDGKDAGDMFPLHNGDGEEGLDRYLPGIVAQALRGNNHIRKVLGLFPGGADADEPAAPGETHGARGDGVATAADPPERQYPIIAVVEEKGVSVSRDEACNDIE